MHVDIAEAMRYLGAESDAATEALVREAAAELEQRVQPRFVYRVLPVTASEEGAALASLRLPGSMAARMLKEKRSCAPARRGTWRAPSRSTPAAAPL